MSLKLLIDLAAFQILEVICEPFIFDCKQPEESRFPGSLITDYANDIVELDTWPEHSGDRPKHEELQDLTGIITIVSPKEMPECEAYSLVPVHVSIIRG